MSKDLRIVSRIRSKIDKIIPDASAISVIDICIGRGYPLNYYSFGFSVLNKGNNILKVVFKLDQVDNEGYVIDSHTISGQIDPAKKCRFWSGFHERNRSDLKNYIIKEVSISQHQGNKFEAIFSIHPHTSITRLFSNYGEKDPSKVIAIILIAVLFFYLIKILTM